MTQFGIRPRSRAPFAFDRFGTPDSIAAAPVAGLPRAMRREAALLLREAGLAPDECAMRLGLEPAAVRALVADPGVPHFLPHDDDGSARHRPAAIKGAPSGARERAVLVFLVDSADADGAVQISLPALAHALDFSVDSCRGRVRRLIANGYLTAAQDEGATRIYRLTEKGRRAAQVLS